MLPPVFNKGGGPKVHFIQQTGADLLMRPCGNVDDLLSHLVHRHPVHLSAFFASWREQEIRLWQDAPK